jgi:hypothetical protein
VTIDGTEVVFVRRVEQTLVSADSLIPPDVDRRFFSSAACLSYDAAKSSGSADAYRDRLPSFSVEMGQDQASVHPSLLIGARFYLSPGIVSRGRPAGTPPASVSATCSRYRLNSPPR